MVCIACKGHGWVDSQFHGPRVCPVCKGQGRTGDGYDQDDIWRKLTGDRNVDLEQRLAQDIEEVDISSIIAHFVFDRLITPQGNLYIKLMWPLLSVAKESALSRDQLIANGYVVQEDGKVQTVNDLPVGRIYDHLMQWGGPSTYSAWEMMVPIEVDPNRKGNPLFMDNNLLAIRVRFKKEAKGDPIVNEAFLALEHQLSSNDVGKIVNWKLASHE